MISSIQNIIVFDLETTGLKADKNCIVEIACCPFNQDLKDLQEYNSGIIKPYGDREISQGALNANGITIQQLENGVDSEKIIKEFVSYLSKLKAGRNKPILAGHNIDKFDIPFLDDFFKFHKYDLSKYVNFDFTIDTMWWARVKWKESLNYKLGTCCANEKIELIDGHRAMNDTRANKQLVKKFIQGLKSGSSEKEKEEYKRPVFQF